MSAPIVSPVAAFPVNKLLQGVRSSTSFSAERMTRGAGGDLAFLADDGTPGSCLAGWMGMAMCNVRRQWDWSRCRRLCELEEVRDLLLKGSGCYLRLLMMPHAA